MKWAHVGLLFLAGLLLAALTGAPKVDTPPEPAPRKRKHTKKTQPPPAPPPPAPEPKVEPPAPPPEPKVEPKPRDYTKSQRGAKP